MPPKALSLKPPKGKSKKTKMKFQTKHASMYGLVVTAGGEGNVACRFCMTFGREAKAITNPSKTNRATTSKIKMFKTFRTDLYTQHHNGEHPEKWAEYKTLLTKLEQETFFADVAVPHQETMIAHYGENELYMHLNSSIVDVIIGQLLFHPDDFDGLTHKRALSLFVPVDENDDRGYTVTIKKTKLFSLVVKFVAAGSSFRQTACLAQIVRDETGLVCYSGVTELMVSNFVRVVSATGLQCLSKLLSTTSGFSIALDCGTLHGTSYLDVRCRFALRGKLFNFHMMAVPLFERHTASYLFEVLEKYLDAMLSTWRGLIVGVSTDGETTMTGYIKGLATRIAKAADGQKIVRVWCGLHQLDLVMKRSFQSALDGKFVSDLTDLIGYLRRQKNWSKLFDRSANFWWLRGGNLCIPAQLADKSI